MASYFWVGGSGTWDAATTTHWALTSGGAGAAGVPTSADTVTFDANSGASITVTLSGSPTCKSLTLSGISGTFTWSGSAALVVAGNISLGNTTFSGSPAVSMSATGTYTYGGNSSGMNLTVTGGTCTIAGGANLASLTVNAGCTATASNTSGPTISGNVTVNGTGTLNLGNGTFSVSGNFTMSASGTLSAGTGTLSINGSSASSPVFATGGKTYNTVQYSRGINSGTGMTISGGGTIGTLVLALTGGSTGMPVSFAGGSTTTINALTQTGFTASKLLTLQSTNTTNWTISKASGSIDVSFANISRSTATGGAVFTATNSTDGGNNTGWIFPSVASGGSLMFGCNF